MKIADFRFDDPSPKTAAALHSASANDGLDIVSRFAEMVALHGQRRAVVDEDGSLTYAELAALAHRIARVLHGRGLAPETRVGVMLGRHRYFVAAMLGVLEAGCVYVPLEPTLPLERRRLLVSLAGAEAVVASTETAGDLQQLEWRCPRLRFSLTLGTDDVDGLVEAPGELGSTELWDHIAAAANDDVAAGGWKSAFTGLPLSDAAMTAFGANARNKVASFVRAGARVLEIGCASGFTMRHIAPLVASYVASDLTRHNAERVEVIARRLGLTQVTGRHMAAHDIDLLPAGRFDLVVMNSVVESFPGFGYLRSVLDKAAALLAPGGSMFLGSLWDLSRREAYMADLATFAREHAGEGYTTRSDLTGSFFVPLDFFRDWAAKRTDHPSIAASAVLAPGFEPARYAFDVIVRFDGQGAGCETGDRTPPLHLDGRALAAEASEPLGLDIGPRRAAYVIFTSGSSGQPKGVLMEHAPVINLARVSEEQVYVPLVAAGASPPLAISCSFTFAFDGSIIQLLTPLLNGHTVHVPGNDTRQDPHRLHAFIESHRLHVADATPSLFGMLVDYWHERAERSSARCFILGGEAVSATLMERFFDLPGHRHVEVWNQYGPTEACVMASQYRLTAANWAEVQPPPIGGPLPGVEIMVCDDAGRPLPVGIPGEIRIAGAGLARGYLDEPELTARSFVFDEQGTRWYRTGDIGRWLRPGLLLFIGREDRQVKVRGYRIELPEIESALLASPLVRQAAVVVADPRQDGDRVLVAYVVAHPGFDAAHCRTELDVRLPAWMMPAWIVSIDSLPLTANGKLDERRLPSPIEGDALAASRREPRPLTRETERALAGLWHKVLEVPVNDGDDDFFLLGGHSVLAVRLVSLIESHFGMRLPLTELFSATTVARMADRIEARRNANDWHPVVAINSDGQRAPLVCFHPVGGNVLCYKGLADTLGADRPIYMVQSSGLEDGQTLQPSVEAMVAGYLRAFKGVVPDRPLVVLGWSFGGLLAWEAACQLRRVGTVVESVIVLDGLGTPEPVRQLLQKDEAEFLAALFDEMGLGEADAFRGLSPDERLDLIVERARGGNYLPSGLDRTRMRRLLALFQHNGLAAVRYQPQPSEVRLLLVRPRVLSGQAPGIPGDDYNGWKPLATGGVELCWIDGTHGQMLAPPFVEQLAAHVRRHLDQIGA
ncbi:MAG TPA: AMP-binding protein [Vicinamibacterales bacterium]|jgi:amino acid adenylation domain-containing protein